MGCGGRLNVWEYKGLALYSCSSLRGYSKHKAWQTLAKLPTWRANLRMALFDQFAPAASELWEILPPTPSWNPFLCPKESSLFSQAHTNLGLRRVCARNLAVFLVRGNTVKSWYLNTLVFFVCLFFFNWAPAWAVKAKFLLGVASHHAFKLQQPRDTCVLGIEFPFQESSLFL